MSERDDRRGESREPVTLKVEYSDATEFVADYTQNISRGGTFVLTRRDFAEGTRVHLVLSFPGLIKPIALEGVVKWCKTEPEDERGVGIQFDDMADDTRARVDHLVIQVAGGHPDVVARNLRVLVVEDNPHVAQLIREGLTTGARRMLGNKVTFQFTTVANGREALDTLARDDFDFMIVDVYLPVLDGAHVIREVRKKDETRELPIVAVSAGGKAAGDQAIQAGADFFLEKPMRLADIVQTMCKLAGIEEKA